MLRKIFENQSIVPLIVTTIGGVGYWHNPDSQYLAFLFVLGLVILYFNSKSERTANLVLWNNILAVVYSIAFAFSVTSVIAFISIIIHGVIVSTCWLDKLTPSEKRQLAEEKRKQREQEEKLFWENRRLEKERLMRKEEQERQEALYNSTHNEFGRPLNPKLPQNCKMLQIHVKYKNGTSGMWQKIGVEHEVRELLENDPRIETFDLGLLSPSDNGRYPEY